MTPFEHADPGVAWTFLLEWLREWTSFMYDNVCQICCNWSRLRPGFKIPAHRNTIPQINMIHHPVTLKWHWAN